MSLSRSILVLAMLVCIALLGVSPVLADDKSDAQAAITAANANLSAVNTTYNTYLKGSLANSDMYDRVQTEYFATKMSADDTAKVLADLNTSLLDQVAEALYLKSASDSLSSAKTSVSAAQTAFDGGDFATALTKAKASLAQSGSITLDGSAAAALAQCFAVEISDYAALSDAAIIIGKYSNGCGA